VLLKANIGTMDKRASETSTGRRIRGRGVLALAVAAVTLAVLLAVRVLAPPVLGDLRDYVFDTMQRWSPRAYEPVPVRIVDIDEESLARHGQWPWSRALLAGLVDRLGEAGAAVVVLDLLLSEPDRASPRRVLDAMRAGGGDAAALRAAEAALAGVADPDQRLAAALARTASVLGLALTGEQAGGAFAPKAGFAVVGPDPAALPPSLPGLVAPLPGLAEAAAGLGAVNVVPDADGVVRQVPLVLARDGVLVPSLAAEAIRVATGAGGYALRVAAADGRAVAITEMRIGTLIVPTTAGGEIWLHYARDGGRRVPAWAVLDGSAAGARLAGAIVLVGTSAAGLKDLRATPLDPAAAGVEIQAEAIEQMLLGRTLARPDWAEGGETLAILAGGLAVLLATFLFGARGAGAVGVAGGLAWAAGAAAAFASRGLLVDPVAPPVATLLVAAAAIATLQWQGERERRFVRAAFARYVSPALLDRLARAPGRLRLGGDTRPLTLLFCDVRNFTRRAEGMDAEDLTRFVNGLMTPLAEAVMATGGTVDKFMGDCLMAFWNAPVDEPDHVRQGCRAALALVRRLDTLNRGWIEADPAFEPVAIGIGLNSGVCSVGNFGSEQRFDYSAIGDVVNRAARFETLSPELGATIVAGDAVRAGAPDFAFLSLGRVAVRGASEPVRVHALVGGPERAGDSAFAAVTERHARLLDRIEAGAAGAADAADALAACRAAAPADLVPLYDAWRARLPGARGAPPDASL